MNGFLLIDKPVGFSSNQALQKIKKTHHVKKMGHTGTLDPFATGLLVVGLGEALKYMQYLFEEPKFYDATLKLGERTDTLDKTGKIIESQPVPNLFQEEVEDVLLSLVGRQEQMPPMYSAKKKDGQRLYELARKGITIERESQSIQIYSIELLNLYLPHLTFRVACSKGTYIRTLGETIANKLNAVGHLTELRRIAMGPFTVEKISDSLIPIETALDHLSSLKVTSEEMQKLIKGQSLSLYQVEKHTQWIRLFCGNHFFGIGQFRDGLLWPKRMISH